MGDFTRRDGFEYEYLRPRQQRADDRETRVFGGGSNERHDSLFNVWKKRILLGLVPPVDFVEKKHGPPSFQKVFARFRNDLREVLLFAHDAGQMEKFRVDGFGNEVRETGFSRPGRSPENHGNEPSRFEDLAYRSPLSNKVLLSDEFIESPGSEYGGKRFDFFGHRSF